MNHTAGRLDDETAEVIGRIARVPFTADSALVEIGLDSLSMLRIVVAFAPDSDQEIDAAELAALRTVGQFQEWLRELAGSGVAR
jgi:aryl carrier-like protein